MYSELTVPLSDVELTRARRGDLDALESLFRAYEGPVYNLARRMCRSPEEAEEVLQETFLEVTRSIGRFRAEGSLAGWVRKIAASKALMRLRADRRRATEPLEAASAVGTGDRSPVSTQPPAERLDLEEALRLLSATARAVVWLHDVEGYTHEEIGEMMQRTSSFSKSQLARAHARLRRLLRGGGP